MKSAFRWFSDWNGYEVGYDEYDVVSLYTLETVEGTEWSFYVAYQDGKEKILEIWKDEDEE